MRRVLLLTSFEKLNHRSGNWPRIIQVAGVRNMNPTKLFSGLPTPPLVPTKHSGNSGDRSIRTPSSCCISLFVAAITSYHKFLILKFWRSEVQIQFHGAKVKMPAGLVLSQGCKGKCICSFQLLKATCIPWFMTPSLYQSNFLLPLSHLLLVTFTFLPPSYTNPCDSFAPTWIKQAALPTSSPSQSHLQSPLNT